ncbi:hypothetical protein LLB_0462 [Legionella longbeachae D-4968]|nr:hypothetical protein LLB_0462 [Legionella longbeachae D-4968]
MIDVTFFYPAHASLFIFKKINYSKKFFCGYRIRILLDPVFA